MGEAQSWTAYHRIAGVLLIGWALYHVFDTVLTREAGAWRAISAALNDAADRQDTMR